ncbi:MAG: putative sulfate exporter family transporter [Acidobacteria bacterium]|nr:putative sulfate exporter family transporter [Acidobacteriota bacterium]
MKRICFIALMALCAWPRIDAAVALMCGVVFSLAVGNPFARESGAWARKLLQTSVVGLGFGVGISQVLRESQHSILYTMIGITLTLLMGAAIGKWLRVEARTSQLISFGTAICGGSAIAAMAPVIKARSEEVAVALATVFMLNAVALLIFPAIGHLLSLSPGAFGLWSALAIHDTSSVVGAASSFGPAALATATTVKLTRALWIMPCVLVYALIRKSDQRVTVPLFIVGFIAAAVIRSVLPQYLGTWDGIAFVARRLLVVTLFLIGAGVSRETLKKVGFRPMLQGVTLWVIVSSVTLAAIFYHLIGD